MSGPEDAAVHFDEEDPRRAYFPCGASQASHYVKPLATVTSAGVTCTGCKVYLASGARTPVYVAVPPTSVVVQGSPEDKANEADYFASLPSGAEQVDHPAHYGGADNPYEAIKVIEAWKLGFNLGNAVKYIARNEKKGAALQDLKKAAWYLDREIKNWGK